MPVPSLVFLAVSIGFALLRGVSANRTWRQWVLLVANLVFLGTFARAPLELLPFIGFVVLGFILVRQAHRPVRAHAIAVAMVVLIGPNLRREFFPACRTRCSSATPMSRSACPTCSSGFCIW